MRKIRDAALRRAEPPEQVPDIACDVVVTLDEVFARARVTVTLPNGQAVKLSLPLGVKDGDVIRMTGQGYRFPDMRRGDALVTVRIATDERFRAEGHDLHVMLPLDLTNGVLGCETTVETPTGLVSITVPEWSDSERIIRVEGKGLPKPDGGRGDLLVDVRLMLWKTPDPKITDLLRSMREGLYL